MVNEDDAHEPPLYRHRRALEMLIGILKTATISVHADAAKLTGRDAKQLREIAEDMDDYAEYLKERLNHRRFQRLP